MTVIVQQPKDSNGNPQPMVYDSDTGKVIVDSEGYILNGSNRVLAGIPSLLGFIDTPKTQTSGIQEAANYIENNTAGGTIKLTSGDFFCTAPIEITNPHLVPIKIVGETASGYGSPVGTQITYTGGTLSQPFFWYNQQNASFGIENLQFVLLSNSALSPYIPFIQFTPDTMHGKNISIINAQVADGSVTTPTSNSIGLLIGFPFSDNAPLSGDMKVIQELTINGFDWGFVGNGDWIHLYDPVLFNCMHYSYMFNVQDIGSTSYNATWMVNTPMITRGHTFSWGYVAIYNGSPSGTPLNLIINTFHAGGISSNFPAPIGLIQNIYSKPMKVIALTSEDETVPDIAQPSGDVPGTTSGVPGPYTWLTTSINTNRYYNSSATAIDFSNTTPTLWQKGSTNTFASGTVYQNVNIQKMVIRVTVQLNATSSTSALATLLVNGIGFTSSSAYLQESEPAGSSVGGIHTMSLDVYPNEIFELQLTNATLLNWLITYEEMTIV